MVEASQLVNMTDDARGPEDDRISALSDPILLRILSLLPTKQFIATAVLSRRRRFLWFSAQSLIFHYNGDFNRCVYFIDFVVTAVMFNSSPKIEKFSVTVNSNWTCRTNHVTTVTSWIRFATVKLVEKLNILLDGEKYTLAPQLFRNNHLRVMNFKGCNIEIPRRGVSCPALESLTIASCGNITKPMIRKILDGCPNIVCLDVVDSYDPDRGREVNHHHEYIMVKPNQPSHIRFRG